MFRYTRRCKFLIYKKYWNSFILKIKYEIFEIKKTSMFLYTTTVHVLYITYYLLLIICILRILLFKKICNKYKRYAMLHTLNTLYAVCVVGYTHTVYSFKLGIPATFINLFSKFGFLFWEFKFLSNFCILYFLFFILVLLYNSFALHLELTIYFYFIFSCTLLIKIYFELS